MRSKKYRAVARIREKLEHWRVLDSVIRLDPHEHGMWEHASRAALVCLEKASASLDALNAVDMLLDAVLSQALNRDPSLPWIVGVRKVSGNVGRIGPDGKLREDKPTDLSNVKLVAPRADS